MGCSHLQADGDKIFNFKKEDIQKLTIKTQKDNLEFEKTNRENNRWQMKRPENVVANDAVKYLHKIIYTSSFLFTR
jgi:hypothetical protein